MEKTVSTDWSQLPPELLELVVLKLPSIERPRFKAVCSSWNAAALKSEFCPLLLLPPEVRSDDAPPISSTINLEYDEEFQENFIIDDQLLKFYCPDVNKNTPYTPLYKNTEIGKRIYQECYVVGSSHGWVMILDSTAELSLINPFSGAEIELPKVETFPHDPHTRVSLPDAEGVVSECYVPLVERAILTGNPSNGADFKVVIIYGSQSRLAFCSHGDMTWTGLTDFKNYVDVACCGNKLYALELKNVVDELIIHLWDLSVVVGHSRISSRVVIPSITSELEDACRRYPLATCNVLCYVVPSLEETFLVARVIGKLETARELVLDSQGNLVPEGLVCSNMTLGFQVYRVLLDADDDGKKLEKVESLVGRAIFVGQNHSTVIPVGKHDGLGLYEESIYFTDDNWDRMNVDQSSGGHDIGIYSLKERTKSLLFDDKQRYEFVPLWVFPGRN